MAINITCTHCQAKLTTDDSRAGRQAKCPKCGGFIDIPLPSVADSPDEEILEAEVNPFRGLEDDEYQLEAPPAPAAASQPTKPCPMCGERINADAVKCRYCGEFFDPVLRKQAKKQKSYTDEDANLTVAEKILAVLCSNIACIFGIVWMVQGKPKGKKMFLIALGCQLFWILVGVVAEMAKQNR